MEVEEADENAAMDIDEELQRMEATGGTRRH
jgi:hypothetical protein